MDAAPTAGRSATRSVIGLAVWTFAWVGTVALARFGPVSLWGDQPAITWIAVGVNLAVGVGWIVAHARYLRSVDELQRKIFVDALAVALGVGLVGGIAYEAAHHAGLVPTIADIAMLSVVMAITYIVSIAVGSLRYR
jgi:hypothetical protein